MTPAELKRERVRAGLSQVALAELLDVDMMTVSRWERGVFKIPQMVSLAMATVRANRQHPTPAPKRGGKPNV